MAKTIFLCQFQMPFQKIASWPNMYNFYLRSHANEIDFIICPPVEERVPNVIYSFSEDILRDKKIIEKVSSKILNENRFKTYLKALDELVEPNEKYVLKIVDNSGLAMAVDLHLRANYDRLNFHILYYFQGFAPMFSPREEAPFMNAIDELLFLTAVAYQDWKRHHNQLPVQVRILHNACDSKVFKTLNEKERTQLKQELGAVKKYTFLWCSQDRPKKGLDLLLRVWGVLPETIKAQSELLIVGVEKEINNSGVRIIGRVPNHELAKYYQVSDFFLFPSLWKEGFGIVLAEALMCGCYCIASDNGGIPEVLGHGKYGRIVKEPNIIESWGRNIQEAVLEIEEVGENPYYSKIPKGLYEVQLWASNMNEIINEAKAYLETKNS